MNLKTRLELIKRVAEEIITEEDLIELLKTKKHPVAYDGFEPSGEAHLGSGLLRAIQLEDLLKAGIKFKLLIADWYAWINNKMGGNLERIKKVGNYLVEVWKACGVDIKKVEIVWTSDIVKDPEYWKLVLEIAKRTTIERMIRCSTIMGRKKAEMQYTAQIFYPAMQAADPFYLKADICQLGMDQRKATILSREIGPKLGLWKPVCIHHHLLIGLKGPTKMGGFETRKDLDLQISSKMSKSIPKSYISVHDSPEKIREKVMDAFCPAKIVEGNPILEICKYIIFRKNKKLVIERPKKYGGTIEVKDYEELENLYRQGKIHPKDLKLSIAKELSRILKPVREYFEKKPEILEIFKEARVTR